MSRRSLAEVMWRATFGLCLAAQVAAGFAFGAVAQENRTSGAELLNECRDLTANSGDRIFSQGYCLGAIDAAALLHDRYRFCIPGSRPKLQLVRIVVDYVERHPKSQHLQLAVLASLALTDAFPCPTR